MKKLTVGIITSRGGHLYQVVRLKRWWSQFNRFFVTFPGEDTSSLLSKERVYFAHYPESRNVINAIKNLFLARHILKKEQPDVLISCGAGIAPPFFLLGKLFGSRLIFIEPYDFIKNPSLSAKLVESFVDLLLVQHEGLVNNYKRAVYKGSLF